MRRIFKPSRESYNLNCNKVCLWAFIWFVWAPNLYSASLPYSFSGNINNPNVTIPAGYYGNLTANGGFGWQTGTCSKDVATNGYVFTLDSGNGNSLNYSGIISGNGSVILKSGSYNSSCCSKEPLILSGASANTYKGMTTIAKGVVELRKNADVLAIPGDLTILQQGNNDELRWGASYQMSKTATLLMNSSLGVLNLNGYSEKIGTLKMIKNSKLLTDSSSASGQLVVDSFWYDNVQYANQVYTAANAPFIQGKGQLIVGPQLPPSYDYKSIKGATIKLYPYTGRNIALLVTAEIYDPVILGKITLALDKAYDFYKEATGREPTPFRRYNGLATIAMVEDTCGAGCGYLGASGIELQTGTYKRLFNYVKNYNQYDQAVFYELGRNFWFYGKKIEYVGSDAVANITTGYAVYMRFLAMDAAGVVGAPFGKDAFETFRQNVMGVIDIYLNDPSLNWENTLKLGRSPKGNVTSLFASFMFRLECDFGSEFIKKFWQKVALQPNRVTTQDAVNNFINAASQAAGEDLTDYFAAWRWPVQRPTE
jgi:autotransporter-associated beta strand protein